MRKLNNYFLIFALIIIAVEAILFYFSNDKLNEYYERQTKENEQKVLVINKFTKVKVQAKAFSIYDATEQEEIFGKNQYRRLPIASLIKTLTVLVVLDEKKLDDQIKISEDDLAEVGDNGLLINEKWKISDLAKFTLILSSNDGARALVQDDSEFLGKMKLKAEEIGMKNFSFLNFTGLDIDEAISGAYASAEDVNIMNTFALKNYPEIFLNTTFAKIKIKSDSKIEHVVENTNIITNKISNLLFSKTGYTQLAGGNLSVIFKDKNNHDIVITVLGSTMDGRFSDMENLLSVLLF